MFLHLFFIAAFTPVVQLVKAALCPDGVHNVGNAACCALFPVMDDLSALFGGDNMCSEFGSQIIRLAFHDAIGIDPTLGGGGADGSIVTFFDVEEQFPQNEGMGSLIEFLQALVDRHGISAGDILHFAAAVSVVNCPGAPQMEFAMGRPPAIAPSPPNLIPNPFDSVDQILQRFASVQFSPREVVALLAAHSVAKAYITDKTVPGSPLDSTPHVFDTQFFLETLLIGTAFPGTGNHTGEVKSAVKGVLRLQSDSALAQAEATACSWRALIDQDFQMQSQFASAMFRLSLLGQQTESLIDCSEVLPLPLPAPDAPHYPFGLGSNDTIDPCEPFPSVMTATVPGPTITPAGCEITVSGSSSDMGCWFVRFNTVSQQTAPTSSGGNVVEATMSGNIIVVLDTATRTTSGLLPTATASVTAT